MSLKQQGRSAHAKPVLHVAAKRPTTIRFIATSAEQNGALGRQA